MARLTVAISLRYGCMCVLLRLSIQRAGLSMMPALRWMSHKEPGVKARYRLRGIVLAQMIGSGRLSDGEK